MEDNVLRAQKTSIPKIGKMAITILIVATMAVSLALAPSGIYQLAKAQTTATATVIVFVHLIHTDAGPNQVSHYDVVVASAPLSTRTHGSTCAGQGTYTTQDKQGSESGTSFTIPAPSCFFVEFGNLQAGTDTITSSPCDKPQLIRPGQTDSCTYTITTQ